MSEKITKFTDLIAWQKSYQLVISVYKVTDLFPTKEKYALTSQMRRASVSISSNIAEGFSRRTRKEKLQFYSMSMGSLTELENQIIIACGIKYVVESDKKMLVEQIIAVQKLINGLIKGLEKIRNS